MKIFCVRHWQFASERPQIRTWGRQTCFFPRALFSLVTPLYGTRAFLFCHNVLPSCYVKLPQFYHTTWWCWRNTPGFLYISLLGKGLCCAGMESKIEVQETVKKLLIFSKHFCALVKVARSMPAIL